MFRIILFVFALFSSSISNAEIITDDSGNKYITIGSSKDEVLEVLGTPTDIKVNGIWWQYGFNYIIFNNKGKIEEYSGGEALKVRLIPKSRPQGSVQKNTQVKSEAGTVPYSSISSPDTSKSTYSSTSSSTSGYGEISSTTGRAKTVHVRGYTKKDGTYVSPHYRSPPRKK